MEINMKSWFFKISFFSILVFIFSAIMLYLILNPFRSLSDNATIYFSCIILPSFVITLLFNREITRWKSILFGGFIGFFGGQIWLIYWIFSTLFDNTTYVDYSFLPMIWLPFSVLFIGSGIGGAFLSHLIRKYYNQNSQEKRS